ncbi:FG-GAP repeat protein [Capilliphycus salinus ALCB114379]|uniref:FG-GAP repeat protein n=1 Tax=Capilliphycus salinus TaxID=2768948 RepID=UPI0039A40F1A
MKQFLLIPFAIIGGGFLMITLTWSPKCLESELGDTISFGYSLALNKDYLAVGDPEANRVVLYHRDTKGDWSRIREILPPKGSTAKKVRAGFGYDLAIDEDMLVIGAYLEQHKAANTEAFQWTNQLEVSFSGGVYKVVLGKETEVQRVDTLAEGEIAGFSVSVDNGQIAFGIKREVKPGIWMGLVGLIGDNLKRITPPTDSSAQHFGVDVAISNNLLLVGAPFDDTGAAWLFNLQKSDSLPQRLTIPDVRIGSAVAISDKFAVVSGVGSVGAYTTDSKTLILTIKDSSTTVVNSFGDLSLDNNFLAVTRSQSGDGEQPAQLDLFDLSVEATPRLVDQRKGIYPAQVHDNTLISVQESTSGNQVCIEQGIQ